MLQSNLLVVMEDLMPMFAAGQLGMMMVTGTTYNVPTMINQFGINKDDVGIALLPAGPAGRATRWAAHISSSIRTVQRKYKKLHLNGSPGLSYIAGILEIIKEQSE